jgi:hypothetical protein
MPLTNGGSAASRSRHRQIGDAGRGLALCLACLFVYLSGLRFGRFPLPNGKPISDGNDKGEQADAEYDDQCVHNGILQRQRIEVLDGLKRGNSMPDAAEALFGV